MSATIERLKQSPHEMTIAQAAYVLGRSDDHVARAIISGRIESRADPGRGLRRQYILITTEALLVYIVRSTGGDRLTLMQAIKEHLPERLYSLAQSITAPTPPAQMEVSAAARRKIIPHPALQQHPEFAFTASLAPEDKQSA